MICSPFLNCLHLYVIILRIHCHCLRFPGVLVCQWFFHLGLFCFFFYLFISSEIILFIVSLLLQSLLYLILSTYLITDVSFNSSFLLSCSVISSWRFWGVGWRALFSSQVDSCFLPTTPSFTHSFFAPVVLLTCPTLLFVRPKFHLNNSIKDFSLLFSVGELSSFSFLLSLIRALCLVPGAPFSWGFEETRPHAREGVEWVEPGLVLLVVGSGLGSSSVTVWIALHRVLLCVPTDESL